MTIALSLKVNEGMVLAADSATTMTTTDANGADQVAIVYNNANKIFNLCKGLPIGAVTWGLGNIGIRSTATLMKDLRARLCGDDDSVAWKLDPANYSVHDVATRLCEYVHQERYVPTFVDPGLGTPPMGFFVAGYSSKQPAAEVYQIDIAQDGTCAGPQLLSGVDGEGTIAVNGQPTAIRRLLWGYDERLPRILHDNLGIDDALLPQVVQLLNSNLANPLFTENMPIQDAADLAEFLATVSAQFIHFATVPDTVGGPIELAAITRYEGFRWIKRKHFYGRELNPEA